MPWPRSTTSPCCSRAATSHTPISSRHSPRRLDHRAAPRPHSGQASGRKALATGTIAIRRKGRECAMPQVALTVNGKKHTVEVEGRTLLVELLREKLGLTGTNVGCDTSQCGACVVDVDGMSAKSCTMLALQVEGCSITTI